VRLVFLFTWDTGAKVNTKKTNGKNFFMAAEEKGKIDRGGF
jgi:hypothetical protein